MRTFEHAATNHTEIEGELVGAEGSFLVVSTIKEAVRTMIEFMTIETSEGTLGEFAAE